MQGQFVATYHTADRPFALRVQLNAATIAADRPGKLFLCQTKSIAELPYLTRSKRLTNGAANDLVMLVRCGATATVADLLASEVLEAKEPVPREVFYELFKKRLSRQHQKDLGLSQYQFGKVLGRYTPEATLDLDRLEDELEAAIRRAGSGGAPGPNHWAKIGAEYFASTRAISVNRIFLCFSGPPASQPLRIDTNHSVLLFLERLAQMVPGGVVVVHDVNCEPNIAGQRALAIPTPSGISCSQALKALPLPPYHFVHEAIEEIASLGDQSRFAEIFRRTDELAAEVQAALSDTEIGEEDFGQLSSSAHYQWVSTHAKLLTDNPATLITSEEGLRAAAREIQILIHDLLSESGLSQFTALTKSLQRANEALELPYTKGAAVTIGTRLNRLVSDISKTLLSAKKAESENDKFEMGETAPEDLEDLREQASRFVPSLTDYMEFIRDINETPEHLTPNASTVVDLLRSVDEILENDKSIADDEVRALYRHAAEAADYSMSRPERLDMVRGSINLLLTLLKRIEALEPGKLREASASASSERREKFLLAFVDGLAKGIVNESGKTLMVVAGALIQALAPLWSYIVSVVPLFVKLSR